MRKATLKTYTQKKLKEYVGGSLKLVTLLLQAQKDQRVGYLAQAYFLARGKQNHADLFVPVTHQSWSVKAFPTSDQKYAWEFRELERKELMSKDFLRKFVKEYKEKNDFTWNLLARQMNVDVGNVYRFFVKNENNQLSTFKLFNFYEKLKQNN